MQIRLTSRLMTEERSPILKFPGKGDKANFTADAPSKESSEKLKISVAQIKTAASRIGENSQKIIELIQEADKNGSDIISFPELTIPGYLSHYLFNNPRFIR